MEGIVKWFDAKKGYGFIVSEEVTDDSGKPRDIFVHYTKIKMEGFKKLEASEAVTFDLISSPDGKPQADNIVRQDSADASGK
jgi:CspA family cold shock protein